MIIANSFSSVWKFTLPVNDVSSASSIQTSVDFVAIPSTSFTPTSDSIIETQIVSDSPNVGGGGDFISLELQDPSTSMSRLSMESAKDPRGSAFSDKTILGLRLNIFIVIIAALVVVILFTLIMYWALRNKKRGGSNNSKRANTSDLASESITDDATYSGATTITAVTSPMTGTTTLVGDTGLSVPAYLECKYGIDVRATVQIAKGGFSTVSLAEPLKVSLKGYGDQVIVKLLIDESHSNLEKLLATFYQEIAIMSFLGQHQNIAKLLGYCQKPYGLILKYYPYGSLNEWLEDPSNKMTTGYATSFGLDIARGLAHMHSKGICHADIKPHNILIDDVRGEMCLVLTDFGIAQVFTAQSLLVGAFLPVSLNALSLKYAAPEAILRLTTKQPLPSNQVPFLDVYSFGITFYEILCRRTPYT